MKDFLNRDNKVFLSMDNKNHYLRSNIAAELVLFV